MAQVYNDEESKKLQPLTVPKIVEQLERALMDLKYSKKDSDDELEFNNTENVPIKSETPPEFIGKELMLFEMIGVLNGKITELQKKYNKLRVIEDKEQQFVSEKADEIAIPIKQIRDYAERAKSGEIEKTDALEGIINVAHRLQNITTLVLDTKRIENETLKVSKRYEKINETINEAVRNSNIFGPKVPIRVGLDNDVEIPVDKIRLTQVLESLLANAIKHTEFGQIKVESFVAHEQNVVIIRIDDSGTGIPQDKLLVLFEKGMRKKNPNDITLSLYLCQGIIHAHGGNIVAKNNKTQGATFTITLPIK